MSLHPHAGAQSVGRLPGEGPDGSGRPPRDENGDETVESRNRARRFWSWGLRARVVAPLLLIGLSLAAADAWMILHTSEKASREHLTSRASAIARAIGYLAETTTDEAALQLFVAAMSAESDIKLIVVAAGEPLTVVASSQVGWLNRPAASLPDSAHTYQDLARAVASRQRRIEFHHDAEETIDFTAPLRTRLRAAAPSQWSSGAVMLHLDGQSFMRTQTQNTRSTMATLGLAVLLAAVVAHGLLRRVVLWPMEQITQVAYLVAKGARTARVASTRQDEFGQLASAIDAMIDELVCREAAAARAKEEAIGSQQRLESALAELSYSKFALDQHAIVAVTDLAGRITYANDRFCQISQYRRQELIGRTHRIVNSGRHPQAFWDEMWGTIRQGEVWRGEVCNRAKDGSVYWVDTTIVPYKNDHGEITQYVAIRTDITARKTAEAELRESRERLDLALRGSSDGIWDWNVVTGNVYYSPRFKELLDYPDDEFPPHIDTFLRLLHPDDTVSNWEAVQRHLVAHAPYDVTYRLRARNGDWRWFRAKGAAIRDLDGVARRMAGSISDITALKKAEEQLVRDAWIDGLTGLPNRMLLLERLRWATERARLSGHEYAVLFLDFDRFKLINDSLGHEAGDDLLRQIAARLREQVRTVDSVSRSVAGNTSARLGGDEFVVLLQDVGSRDDVVTVVQRLLAALASPYQIYGHEVYSTASIGVVLGSAAYERAEDVLRDADTAMYEAKRAGKACYVVFDQSMRQRVLRRQQLEGDLRRAIEAAELELEFQPIVDLRTGRIRSMEALVRWWHPQLGRIDPAELTPIAEESGIIMDLGHWSLRTACRQFAIWRRESGAAAPRRISLNVSQKEFTHPRLVDIVRDTLAEFDMAPTCLELELTENILNGDAAVIRRTFQSLKALGVSLALDNFGVGSCSLAALHQFPVDTLKVDRSVTADFPRSPEAAALIHGLIVIARDLRIQLVVQGVEESAQAVSLTDLGCGFAQGFHFSRPLPYPQVLPFLGVSPPAEAARG